MSEYEYGFIVGLVVAFMQSMVTTIVGHYFGWWYFGAPPKQDAPPPPSEGWIYTKTTNKPDKRPVPPRPDHAPEDHTHFIK